jgi:hypothetical protein
MPLLPPERLIELNGIAFGKNWKKFLYKKFKRFLETFQFRDESDRDFLWSAMHDARAMMSWDKAIQQEFYFVARDYTGSYIIPKSNRKVVYKVVGLMKDRTASKLPSDPISFAKTPALMKITVLPWYGRLLYDATALPAKGRYTCAVNGARVEDLYSVVREAIRAGTVIEFFEELDG